MDETEFRCTHKKMAWSWYGVAEDIILACDPVIINLLNGLVVEKAEERLFVEKREPRIKNHFMDVERPVRDTVKPHFPYSLLGVCLCFQKKLQNGSQSFLIEKSSLLSYELFQHHSIISGPTRRHSVATLQKM